MANGYLSRLRAAVSGAAIMTMLAPTTAVAETWAVVLPPNMPRSGELKTELWDFLRAGLEPGSSLTLYDGLKVRELLRIEVPDDPRFTEERLKLKMLRGETAQFSNVLDGLSAPNNPEIAYRVSLPDFAYEFAQARLGEETEMLVVTSAIHLSEREPSFSFRLADGVLYLPTDAHLSAPLATSPYGTRGRDRALAGVALHLCFMSDDTPLTTHQKDELRRFWTLYVDGLGGELATFTEDLAGCIARWRAKRPRGLADETLGGADGVLAMRAVSRTPLEEWEEKARFPPGVKTFAQFKSKPHPLLEGVEVTTGVRYSTDEYPDRYQFSWCYFEVENNGATISFTVGGKSPLREPRWATIERGALEAAGITRGEAEAGQAACQFPGDTT